MKYVYKEVFKLKGKTLTIGELDDTINKVYEGNFIPYGTIKNNYIYFTYHNQHWLRFKIETLKQKENSLRNRLIKITKIEAA